MLKVAKRADAGWRPLENLVRRHCATYVREFSLLKLRKLLVEFAAKNCSTSLGCLTVRDNSDALVNVARNHLKKFGCSIKRLPLNLYNWFP